MDRLEKIQRVFFTKVPVRAILAIVLVFSVLGLTFILCFRVIPKENNEPFMMILGSLLMKLGTVYDWNFGASKTESDAKKVDAINQTLP